MEQQPNSIIFALPSTRRLSLSPPPPVVHRFSRNSQPRSFSFPSSIITSPPRSNATLNLPGVVQDNLSGHPKKERKFRIDCEITSFRFCFVQKHVIHIHVVEAHQLDKFQTLALCKVINASSGRGTFCSWRHTYYRVESIWKLRGQLVNSLLSSKLPYDFKAGEHRARFQGSAALWTRSSSLFWDITRRQRSRNVGNQQTGYVA